MMNTTLLLVAAIGMVAMLLLNWLARRQQRRDK